MILCVLTIYISVSADLPGEMERIECQFNNYDSDVPLDNERIPRLMTALNSIIAPNSSISISSMLNMYVHLNVCTFNC